jgi:hypothetical protein
MYGLNNASKTPIAAITLLVREKAFSQRLLIETKIKSWPVLNFNTTFATKSARSGQIAKTDVLRLWARWRLRSSVAPRRRHSLERKATNLLHK